MGSEGANVCPACMAKYPGTVTKCSADGTMLVPEETFAHVDKDLAEGSTVGEYRIEGKLGEGGFGAVFRGVHPVIGKTAAIKVLSRQFSSNPQMVSRFIAEARAVNQIRHRNIIDIFSFGQLPDGRQYYVMELLDGTPFDKYLATHKRLSLGQSLPILRGIARALDAAHGKDILHRDLKPENVYLVFDEDGGVQAKLLDFGLVKLLTESSGNHKTKTGTPMGTPYYMSPEQCRGHEVDRRTDVYSFGVMVYEVLTGEMPFTGESAMDILMKHITAEPAPPSAVCPEVSPALDRPIMQMLAKDAKDRPTTVGEALEQLLAAANRAGVMSPDSGSVLPPPHAPVSESYQAAATIPAVTGAIGAGNLPAAAISSKPSGGVKIITGGGEATSEKGSTFLATEAEVAAPRPSRSKALAGIAMAGLALAVGGAIWFSMKQPKVAPQATGVVQATAAPASVPAASQVASVTTPSATASAPPPAPTEVAITLTGAPPGATITADGKPIGSAPGPVSVKPGVETKLSVTAKGWKTRELKIAPTADTTVDATLEKSGVKPNAGTGTGAKPPPQLHPDLLGPGL